LTPIVRQGASVDEITREVTRTRKDYENTKDEILTMVTLNKVQIFCFLH
jgi:hypothetical protein